PSPRSRWIVSGKPSVCFIKENLTSTLCSCLRFKSKDKPNWTIERLHPNDIKWDHLRKRSPQHWDEHRLWTLKISGVRESPRLVSRSSFLKMDEFPTTLRSISALAVLKYNPNNCPLIWIFNCWKLISIQ